MLASNGKVMARWSKDPTRPEKLAKSGSDGTRPASRANARDLRRFLPSVEMTKRGPFDVAQDMLGVFARRSLRRVSESKDSEGVRSRTLYEYDSRATLFRCVSLAIQPACP